MNYQEKVREFNEAFGHIPAGSFAELSKDRHNLRQRLNREEWLETLRDINRGDDEGILDGACDMMYVILGHALEVDLPIQVDGNYASVSPLGKFGELIYQLDFFFCFRNEQTYKLRLKQAAEAVYSFACNYFHPTLFNSAFEEVHRANMAKLWTDDEVEEALTDDTGKYGGWTFEEAINKLGYFAAKREDGKIMKPPSWTPPNLKQFLN